MVNCKTYIYIPLITVIATLVFSHPSLFAKETVKDIIVKNYKETKDISPVIKKLIQEGIETKDVVMVSIQLGHDACLVIKSAVEAGGNFEQIIAGALAGGATADVCSRCMIEAGADPAKVAQALETVLGYSLAMGSGLSQIDIGLPGHTRGGGFVSPHSPE
jgi:hypothetical protein